MMSVEHSPSEEPQAAFEVLQPSEVERIRVEELHHQPEVSEPQLTRACALRKAEALYTPDVEGLLTKLEEEGKPLEVAHTVELKEVLAKWLPLYHPSCNSACLDASSSRPPRPPPLLRR